MSSLNYIPWLAGGVGLAALENKLIADEIPDPLKTVNLGVGAVTGFLGANPSTRMSALNSLPFKQLGLFGVGAMDKFRRQQQSLVDTNLATAGINKDTARLQQDDAGDRKAMALAFLLPALVGSGALAYYAYNKGHKSAPSSRFQTVDSKGAPKGRRRVKIEVPASALPDEFFSSLINVDDNSKAFTRVQEKSEAPSRKRASTDRSIPGMVWDTAQEFTGLPSVARSVREMGDATAQGVAGNYGEAARYGGAAVGNAAMGALGLQTMPWLLGKALTQKRLADWRNSRNFSTSGFLEPKLPHIGNWIWRHSFGNQLSPEQAKVRQGMSAARVAAGGKPLDMRGALDRARDIKFRYDPKRFAWSSPTAAKPYSFGSMFNRLLTEAPAGARSTGILGRAADIGRFGANRAVNAAYWTHQLARRNPMASLFALGLPLSGLGIIKDDDNLNAARAAGAANSFFTAPSRNGRPVSQTLDSILGLIGGNQPHPVVGQLR